MAGCFPDFRDRASSFDLHTLHISRKVAGLNRLLRSKSDMGLKIWHRSPSGSPSGSPRDSPRGSPGTPHRRRFARVIRDDEAKGEEYVNPHVTRKYNRRYLLKSVSLDDPDHKLPYKVSGHTILKKHGSMEVVSPTHPHKHACFNEDVEVVQFDTKVKCASIKKEACVLHEKLHDDHLAEPDLLLLEDSRDLSPIDDTPLHEDDDEVFFESPMNPLSDESKETNCDDIATGLPEKIVNLNLKEVQFNLKEAQLDYKPKAVIMKSHSSLQTGPTAIPKSDANNSAENMEKLHWPNFQHEGAEHSPNTELHIGEKQKDTVLKSEIFPSSCETKVKDGIVGVDQSEQAPVPAKS